MGEGSYNPGSATGKRLLAHELTHVVQQGGGKKTGSKPRVQRQELEEEELLQTKPLVGRQEIPNTHEGLPED
jgi:hypothetical protein